MSRAMWIGKGGHFRGIWKQGTREQKKNDYSFLFGQVFEQQWGTWASVGDAGVDAQDTYICVLGLADMSFFISRENAMERWTEGELTGNKSAMESKGYGFIG